VGDDKSHIFLVLIEGSEKKRRKERVRQRLLFGKPGRKLKSLGEKSDLNNEGRGIPTEINASYTVHLIPLQMLRAIC